MPDFSKKIEAERREMPEPYESNRPIPWIVILIVGGLFVWAIAYIAVTHQSDPPAMGDRRTVADFAVAAGTGGTIDGGQVYTANCVACHQATGAGLSGVFPPLAGSEWVAGKESAVIQILLHGITGPLTVHGTVYNGAMPAFAATLSDEQIAAVLTHVRASFGNSAGPIDAAQVQKEREATKDRTTPWNGDEDLAKLK
jgi:mono/diheme cytochrome c family protein